jgi:hypothetical protein
MTRLTERFQADGEDFDRLLKSLGGLARHSKKRKQEELEGQENEDVSPFKFVLCDATAL